MWARADRPSRMFVEVSPTETFRRAPRIRGPILDATHDLTGKVRLTGLPAGQDVFYRVVLADPDDDTLTSEPEVGRLRTAAAGGSDIRFLWSADLGGQGWGIDHSRGGYRIFESMRRLDPDFFICSGDLIYADGVQLHSELSDLVAEEPLVLGVAHLVDPGPESVTAAGPFDGRQRPRPARGTARRSCPSPPTHWRGSVTEARKYLPAARDHFAASLWRRLGAADSRRLRAAVTPAGIAEHLSALDRIAAANAGTRASGTPGYLASRDFDMVGSPNYVRFVYDG